MSFFGKKEEAKKELRDINQIKEMISPSENLPNYESPSTQDLIREVNLNPTQPENTTEFSAQQLLSGNIPRVESLQTPNISNQTSVTTGAAVAERNPIAEIPESAPLFIKLDRYKNILHNISDIRNTVTKVRNAFEMFSEMERVKAENLRVLEAAIQKVEARIIDLDSEFQKPIGNIKLESQKTQRSWEEYPATEPVSQPQSEDNLHVMIEDLRGQIGKLKEELNDMGPDKKENIDDLDHIDE